MSFSNRFKVLGLLGIPLLAVAVAVLVLAWGTSATETQAANNQAKTQMDLVAVQGGAVCDSSTAQKCTLSNASPFTLSIVPSAIPVGGYSAWQTEVNYGALGYKPLSPGQDEITWDLEQVTVYSNAAPIVNHGDSSGLFPPLPLSNQKTALVTMNFNCDQANTIVALNDLNTSAGGAVFIESDGVTQHIPNVSNLEINCEDPTPPPPTDTPTPIPPTATPTDTPSAPSVVKSPTLQNIFLTRQGAKIPPATCLGATDGAVISQDLTTKVTGVDKHGEDRELGAFEFEINYDEEKVCVTIIPGGIAQAWLAAGGACIIQDSVTKPTLQGVATIACNKLGKEDLSPPVGDPDNVNLATIVVQPMPDNYSIGKPNNGNGNATQLINVGCKVADEQGDPVASPPGAETCTDADVTIRWLEGDVEPSCEVDTADTQAIAFRWNSSKGNLLYNDRFNVEPSAPQADDDIDILDLQFVYGRFGSTCDNQWPPQPPVNPKA